MVAVSVIMSTLNTPEAYLRASIESVLNQTFSDFEFIIVDDGSTANDCEIIESYDDPRILLLRNGTNRGLPYSLNRGIEAATGKYLMRMDSDDISLPFRMYEQYEYMESHPDIDILGIMAWKFGSKSGIMGAGIIAQEMNIMMFFKNRLIHPGVMIRKAFLVEHNLRYNEDFKRSQDYELWSRAMKYGKIALLPKVAIKYRVHEKQASAANADDQKRMCYAICCNMLSELAIDLTQEQYEMHYALMNGKPVDDVNGLIKWAKTLITANKTTNRFNGRRFETETNYRLITNIGYHLLRGHYTLNWKITVTLLSPRKVYGALKQMILYKLSNVKAKKNNNEVIKEYCG